MPTTQPGKRTVLVPKIINGVPSGEEEIVVDDTDAPSWGPKDKHRLLNTYLPRADGPHKATGTAKYTHDIKVPNMAYACFVTSPHAHARVKSMTTAAAEEVPGVLRIVQIPNTEEVRFEGQPVAVVAAKTLEAAEEAAHAVAIEWEELPFVVTAEDAMKADAPPAVAGGGGRGGGRGGGNRGGNPDQVLDAVKACDVTVDATYTSVIMHHCCLETHSVVCDYSGGDSATVYCSTQGCGSIASDAARELGLPASKVTGIVYNMGGGFGSKFGIGMVGQWACRLSKQLNQPVKLVLTRREEFLAAGNGPGAIQTFKAGANKDGTLVAVHCIQHALPGIGRSNIAAQPYQYRAAHVYREQNTVNTNEDSSVAMRAPGHPQACFAMESLMDELADKLQMDPVEFRKKNVPDPAWVRQLTVGAKAIGWENRNKTPGKSANGSSLVRGIGCGIGAWGGGGRGGCVATVNIAQDGSVTVQNASQDLGTGTRTYVRAIVAEELGLEYNDVLEEIGDSRFTNGVASGGSTTAASLSPAVKDAAFNAKTEMAKRVAPHLGADPAAVLFADRQIAGNGKALSWKQACAFLPSGGLSVRGEWKPGLSSSNAHGASFAEVEVDMETGHVRVVKMAHVQDGGLILNRMGAESQINGGMIQSLGMALYEGRVMDSNLGVMVNPAFNDYKLPGCLEIPELIPIIDDGDERNAVIGLAEPANIPGSGAIANAVANAIGVRIRELPITPDKILTALANQKA